MNKKFLYIRFYIRFLIFFITLSAVPVVQAGILFKDRDIRLSNDDNRVFSIGLTGTTAGYNFFALVEDATEESISLGELGYWELVPDPPSNLRNYDLQLVIRNNHQGKFRVEFEYDRQRRTIVYRVTQGAVSVAAVQNDYYPKLVINSVPAGPEKEAAGPGGRISRRMLFFDFNSFDSDLRNYYGLIKKLSGNPDYTNYYYYYEAGNYDSYYFKTYDNPSQLDTDKMGLSLEDGTLAYYQKILHNLKVRFGADFADQIIVVSRFGHRFSDELKMYASEIGISTEMTVTFRSYDEME